MSKQFHLASQSAAQTRKAARLVLRALLTEAKPHRPLILALSGELGSGKTTFIQGLARSLGIKEKVLSPTFVLMKIFPLRKKQFQKLRPPRCLSN